MWNVCCSFFLFYSIVVLLNPMEWDAFRRNSMTHTSSREHNRMNRYHLSGLFGIGGLDLVCFCVLSVLYERRVFSLLYSKKKTLFILDRLSILLISIPSHWMITLKCFEKETTRSHDLRISLHIYGQPPITYSYPHPQFSTLHVYIYYIAEAFRALRFGIDLFMASKVISYIQ